MNLGSKYIRTGLLSLAFLMLSFSYGYAQDSEISWVNWDLNDNATAITDFVRRLIELRKAQPLLHRDSWRDMMSVTWLNSSGGEQQAAHWEDGGATTVGIRLARDDLKDREGVWWELIVLFNPHDGEVQFTLPERMEGGAWTAVLDTARPDLAETEISEWTLAPRSLVLLR